MNTKPDNIPALPDGAVYLGKGDKFTRLPNRGVFEGYCFDPDDVSAGWEKALWLGTVEITEEASE